MSNIQIIKYYGGFLIKNISLKEINKNNIWLKENGYSFLDVLWNKYIRKIKDMKIDKQAEQGFYVSKGTNKFINIGKEIEGGIWLPMGIFFSLGIYYFSFLQELGLFNLDINNKTGEEVDNKKKKMFQFKGKLKGYQQDVINSVIKSNNKKQIGINSLFVKKILEEINQENNIQNNELSELNISKKIEGFYKYLGLNTDIITNGFIISPARSGKTIMMIKLAQELGLKTLIIVDKELIFNQFKERLSSFTDINVEKELKLYKGKNSFKVKKGEEENNKKTKIGVGLIQTIANIFEEEKKIKSFSETKQKNIINAKKQLQQYDLVIVDEAHTVATNTFIRSLSGLNFKKIFGFTATRMRGDGNELLLDYFVGPIIKKIEQEEVKELVYDIEIYPLIINHGNKTFGFKEFKRGKEMLNRIEGLKNLFKDENRNNQIVDKIGDALKKDRLILIIGEHISHLERLQNLIEAKFNNKNLDSKISSLIHSKLKEKEKEEILKEFEESGINRANGKPFKKRILLATGSLLGKGFDGPFFDTTFLVSPFGAKKDVEKRIDSRGQLIQILNRIGNKVKGKKQPIIIDIIDIEGEGVLINFAKSRYKNIYKDYYRDLNHNFILKGSWNFF